jgi:hypothetical protein
VAFFSARQLRAHWAPGIPCALSLEGPTILASLARKTRGEIADSRHCEARSDEAIQLSFLLRDGLLRGACHRARVRATRWLAMTGLAV